MLFNTIVYPHKKETSQKSHPTTPVRVNPELIGNDGTQACPKVASCLQQEKRRKHELDVRRLTAHGKQVAS